MNCHFVVGQKVVGVSNGKLSEKEERIRAAAIEAGVTFPNLGEIYTVLAVYVAARNDGELHECLHLVEVVNDPKMKFGNGSIGEIGFSASCFRPVVERKTDISCFTKLLNPAPVKELV